MKKIYLPLALAATLALGACSSDNVVDNGGSNPIDLSKGGFVKMSLNLPTDNNRGSRADLDDGLANEYGIKNAYLVLFEGIDEHNKENEAKFKGAYELENSDFKDFEAVGDNPPQPRDDHKAYCLCQRHEAPKRQKAFRFGGAQQQ